MRRFRCGVAPAAREGLLRPKRPPLRGRVILSSPKWRARPGRASRRVRHSQRGRPSPPRPSPPRGSPAGTTPPSAADRAPGRRGSPPPADWPSSPPGPGID
eukprot:4645130-Pyramimonas_sp.AAC.1